MTNQVYVTSMAQVSCQQPLTDEWFDSPCLYEERYARAIEPNTKGLIMPSEARRMSKILKRTVSTSITALNKSGIKQPDAIITGSGMGCMENSEKFLIDLCNLGETCMKPSLFMQSTHNTISSLIAIILKCHGYNNTYSHKGISFESALFDAWLQIRTGIIRNALVGAHDEVTPMMSLIMETTHPEYSFVSETSFSTMLSNNNTSANVICEVDNVELLHRANPQKLASFLNEHTDDVIIAGINGNPLNDHAYDEIFSFLTHPHCILQYKNVFGDNFSSSAMAFYAGALVLQKQVIPENLIRMKTKELPNKIEGITIINHSDSSEWSVIRLKNTQLCGN